MEGERIIGDYTGTTFEDFLVLPDRPADDSLGPDSVDLESDLCGVKFGVPFFTAAMRSVTGKELMLAAGKGKMMGVAPRGLSPEKEAELVQYTKDHAVKPGELESETRPIRIEDNKTVADALRIAKDYGHSNIPVVTNKGDFLGMFTYTSKHDLISPDTPITAVMAPFKNESGSLVMDVGEAGMSDSDFKDILEKGDYRFIPVLDRYGRLDKLVFIQKDEAYKAGAAIDTHEGWDRRAAMVIEAGADMIFTDTSDADKVFVETVLVQYKEKFPDGPPICAGNIVTPEAFRRLADLGADAIKVGMGPGSICSTNEVLGVGAPPMWALIEVCRARDKYADENGRYVPVIVDGGIENTGNINIAMTHADGLMGGKIFGCFDESAGEKIRKSGRIVGVRIYGEASKEAFETTGNMNRYATPFDDDSVSSFQGVSGVVEYRGRFKPGLETYKKTLREAVYHAGCRNLSEYRERARLIRLSSRAKEVAKPHGIYVISGE